MRPSCSPYSSMRSLCSPYFPRRSRCDPCYPYFRRRCPEPYCSPCDFGKYPSCYDSCSCYRKWCPSPCSSCSPCGPRSRRRSCSPYLCDPWCPVACYQPCTFTPRCTSLSPYPPRSRFEAKLSSLPSGYSRCASMSPCCRFGCPRRSSLSPCGSRKFSCSPRVCFSPCGDPCVPKRCWSPCSPERPWKCSPPPCDPCSSSRITSSRSPCDTCSTTVAPNRRAATDPYDSGAPCQMTEIGSPCPGGRKGPSEWFVQKSRALGKSSPCFEPHYCPWEADVAVSGTVRGHCNSTAVEVAKRMTGQFSSRGSRYTADSRVCDEPDYYDPQMMSLGVLDDGTQLNFCRNQKESSELCLADLCDNKACSCEKSANRTGCNHSIKQKMSRVAIDEGTESDDDDDENEEEEELFQTSSRRDKLLNQRGHRKGSYREEMSKHLTSDYGKESTEDGTVAEGTKNGDYSEVDETREFRQFLNRRRNNRLKRLENPHKYSTRFKTDHSSFSSGQTDSRIDNSENLKSKNRQNPSLFSESERWSSQQRFRDSTFRNSTVDSNQEGREYSTGRTLPARRDMESYDMKCIKLCKKDSKLTAHEDDITDPRISQSNRKISTAGKEQKRKSCLSNDRLFLSRDKCKGRHVRYQDDKLVKNRHRKR